MSARVKQNPVKVETFLSEQAVIELKQEAENTGMTLSGLIRFILLKHLENKQNK